MCFWFYEIDLELKANIELLRNINRNIFVQTKSPHRSVTTTRQHCNYGNMGLFLPFAKPLVSAPQTAGDLESPPAPTYPSHCDWTIRFIKLLSVQSPDFHRELMNHVKRLIFQTWLPAGRMAAAAWQRTDPWLQSSLCCDSQPATAAQNWKRYLGESVCLHSIQSNRRWPSPLSVVKSCWMKSSQFWGNWKLATCSRGVSVQSEIACESKMKTKGATEKR